MSPTQQGIGDSKLIVIATLLFEYKFLPLLAFGISWFTCFVSMLFEEWDTSMFISAENKTKSFFMLRFFSANALMDLKKKKTVYLSSHLRGKALNFRYSSVCVSRSVVSDSWRSYGL